METRESVERCVRRAIRVIGSCVLFAVAATTAAGQTRNPPRTTLNGTIAEQYSSAPIPDATVQLYDSTNRPLTKAITEPCLRFDWHSPHTRGAIGLSAGGEHEHRRGCGNIGRDQPDDAAQHDARLISCCRRAE